MSLLGKQPRTCLMPKMDTIEIANRRNTTVMPGL
jgi:hypothetical protein